MLRQRRLVGGPEPKRTSRFLRYYCFRLSNFTFCDRGSSPEERGAAGGKGPAPASAALAYVTVWQPTAATWSSLMQHLTSVVLLDGGQHPGGRRHCWR